MWSFASSHDHTEVSKNEVYFRKPPYDSIYLINFLFKSNFPIFQRIQWHKAGDKARASSPRCAQASSVLPETMTFTACHDMEETKGGFHQH